MRTPAQRSMQARVAAFSMHAKHGDTTAKARETFKSSFERQVDPDGLLEPEERARRAAAARSAHYSRLALASSLARAKRRAAS